MKFETKAIRIQTERTAQREHSTPIFPTSGYVFNDAAQMRDLFSGAEEGNIYSRYTNPNCQELEAKIAALEGVDQAVSTATGMAAVFAGFLGLLESGDHIISSRSVFGSSYQLLTKYLPKWGITCSFVDPADIPSWSKAMQKNTKMLFLETPSNPGLDIIDLAEAGKFAKTHELIFHVDNCFATPYIQQPAKYGADIISHSATKFIDGQGRVLGGLVAGKSEYIENISGFVRQTGPSLSPFNAWILSKSLETLAVRMDRHAENALTLATQLSDHPSINFVKYPFLPSHPAYEIAKRQMRSGGGLITFELKGGVESGAKFIDSITMLSISANLGDTRTIVTHPASSTHSKVPEETRLLSGITNGLVRVSVGLEAVEDVLADILQALEKSS